MTADTRLSPTSEAEELASHERLLPELPLLVSAGSREPGRRAREASE
jgi:hypothetical protein